MTARRILRITLVTWGLAPLAALIWLAREFPADTIAGFHKLYIERAGGWESTSWMGTPAWKNPLDLWIFQEIIHETRPTVIIETGTWRGGAALYFAHMLDLARIPGKVITIDIQRVGEPPEHPKIHYLIGSSVDPRLVEQAKQWITPEDRVMVTLDADHRKAHVLAELRAYAPLVTRGNYLVVEDTILGEKWHPDQDYQPDNSPRHALEEFLRENRDFEPDRRREKLLMTNNPGGYLRRVR